MVFHMLCDPQSCFGPNLRPASLIIGCFSLVFFGVHFLAVLILSFIYSDLKKRCEGDGIIYKVYEDRLCRFTINESIGLLVGVGLLNFLMATFSILLIVGITKNKPKLLLPYIIGHIVTVLPFMDLALLLIFENIYYVNIAYKIEIIFGLLGCLQIHLLLVTCTCYKQMKCEPELVKNSEDAEEQQDSDFSFSE